MIKGSQLRSWSRRKMQIEGPFIQGPDSDCLVFREFDVLDDAGKSRKRIEATEEVTLVTKAVIKLLDTTALIHVNPALSDAGFVHCPVLQVPQDGARPVVIRFRAARRLDVSELTYLCDMRFME